MLISYSRRFIFIHIYKVAGTSIRDALKPYSYNPNTFLPTRLLRTLGAHKVVSHHRLQKLGGHAHATEVRDALPAEIFGEFYKFAFARNPWDWQVSLYNFALKDPTHHQHELMKSLGGFEKYLEWRVNEELRLQKDFVVDERGELIVDFVGRYETLERDFNEVCARVGAGSRLPHLNRTPRKSYTDYYTPETEALVAEAFREDVEFFGYDFEGSESLPPMYGPAGRSRSDGTAAAESAAPAPDSRLD